MDLFSLLIGFSLGAVATAIITAMLHSELRRDEDIVPRSTMLSPMRAD